MTQQKRQDSKRKWGLWGTEVGIALAISVVLGLAWDTLLPLARQREFFLDDFRIRYSHHDKELVEDWLLILITVVLVLIVLVFEFVLTKSWKRLFIIIGGIIMAVAPMTFVLQFIKLVCARLRPDFIERCMPDENKICTNPDIWHVYKGRTSFPSGHTTTAFFGSTIPAIYLWRRLRPIKEGSLPLSKIMVICFMYLPAWYTAISRSLDNRHHPTDILAGVVLGSGFGWFSTILWDFYMRRFDMTIISNICATSNLQ